MASSEHLAAPSVAPVLSTPDTHIFEAPTQADPNLEPRLSDEQMLITYEIERTVAEIRQGRWRRVALQFPDHMLRDAPRVYEGLRRGLRRERASSDRIKETSSSEATSEIDVARQELAHETGKLNVTEASKDESGPFADDHVKLIILGDTSYGACCVDEIAAEHIDADVVVHYGRSCLSPTARLPVIYVYTKRDLDINRLVTVFRNTYSEGDQKVIVVADVPYAEHMSMIHDRLRTEGYTNVFPTEIIRNPSAAVPNRTVPIDVAEDVERLKEYQIFHISEPPTALLLTLASRAGAIHIYPTSSPVPSGQSEATLVKTTKLALNRRYALLTSLTTTPILGILINTLSVKNYLHVVTHVQKMIAAAGKKSYLFVVGKINAAKLANFEEIGGWVVIGCWESSLVESKDFYRPVITPWELELALQKDEDRLWTGEWTSDFESVLSRPQIHAATLRQNKDSPKVSIEAPLEVADADNDFDDEEESEPPEFDLRMGRYVSHSRPMRSLRDASPSPGSSTVQASQALARRPNGDVVHIGGVASPGAQFLREKRTWQGLGSDFATEVDEAGHGGGTVVEEGRSGVARGYTVGEDARRA